MTELIWRPLWGLPFLESLLRFIMRFRYPVSLPQELSDALGIQIPNTLSFNRLLQSVAVPKEGIANLHRFMPRNQAEKLFDSAVRKERFRQHSLYSYYFDGAWMEFVLHFDNSERLRRLYVQHKDLDWDGIELPLD